jgi:hypothetical protein
MNAQDFQHVFDALCQERGGARELSVAAVAALRQAAQLLTADDGDPRNAAAITSLLALAPPARPRPVERPTMALEDLDKDLPWDLARLDDRQLGLLEELCCLAIGRAEPVRNARLEAALGLVRLLDEIERDGGLPSDEQVNLLRGDLAGILFPVCTLARFLELYAPSDTTRETRVDGAAPLSERGPIPARASNVVRMPSRDASWP